MAGDDRGHPGDRVGDLVAAVGLPLIAVGARPGPAAERLLAAQRAGGEHALAAISPRESDLSEKTVETHLTSVFRKLGVRSRAQVAAAMARAAP